MEESLTENIIGAAIEVHKYLGPGLLESAYEKCLCHELNLRGLKFERQKPIPLVNIRELSSIVDIVPISLWKRRSFWKSKLWIL